MRILVLGGTVFLSRAVAAAAVARGHDVVCAARGVSGTVPDGATLVRWDRSEAVPGELTDTEFDAVVDVSRIPSHVRAAVAAFPDAHWTFVSTVNVYADTATVGGTPATLPLLDPVETDEDPASGPEVYGAMKVACENIVRAGTTSALVIRPGLIVGPGDPSGRFTYWPARFAQAADDGLERGLRQLHGDLLGAVPAHEGGAVGHRAAHAARRAHDVVAAGHCGCRDRTGEEDRSTEHQDSHGAHRTASGAPGHLYLLLANLRWA